MGEYVIMADSTCDLTIEQAKILGIEIVPLNLSIDKAEYKAYKGEVNSKSFYKGLRSGNAAFTSSPNIQTFMDRMSDVLKTGKDIVYISLGSALSSTYQNSCLAADALKKHYPNNNVICIDSKSASLGEALILRLASTAKAQGKTICELAEYIEDIIPRVCHWFTVEDLSFLKKGGRISGTMTTTGTALHIYPVLRIGSEGRLEGTEKVKGRRAAIKALAGKATKFAENIAEQTVLICHGDCQDDAYELAALIKEKASPKAVEINCCVPIIGAHVGPGALGVFFLAKER